MFASIRIQQRLLARFRLEPFALDESVDYLLHQIRSAGGNPETIVTAEALETLARAAHGVPRLLNQVAHRAFCVAKDAELSVVDVEAALEALAGLGWDEGEDDAASAPPAPVRLANDGPAVPVLEHGLPDEASAWPEEEQCAGELAPHADPLSLERTPTPRYFALPRRPA